jgi:hypothetical protein
MGRITSGNRGKSKLELEAIRILEGLHFMKKQLRFGHLAFYVVKRAFC